MGPWCSAHVMDYSGPYVLRGLLGAYRPALVGPRWFSFTSRGVLTPKKQTPPPLPSRKEESLSMNSRNTQAAFKLMIEFYCHSVNTLDLLTLQSPSPGQTKNIYCFSRQELGSENHLIFTLPVIFYDEYKIRATCLSASLRNDKSRQHGRTECSLWGGPVVSSQHPAERFVTVPRPSVGALGQAKMWMWFSA